MWTQCGNTAMNKTDKYIEKLERGQKKKNARMEVACLNVELMIW